MAESKEVSVIYSEVPIDGQKAHFIEIESTLIGLDRDRIGKLIIELDRLAVIGIKHKLIKTILFNEFRFDMNYHKTEEDYRTDDADYIKELEDDGETFMFYDINELVLPAGEYQLILETIFKYPQITRISSLYGFTRGQLLEIIKSEYDLMYFVNDRSKNVIYYNYGHQESDLVLTGIDLYEHNIITVSCDT